jgi:hypothetical protein
MKNFLNSVVQIVKRVTDTRQRAEYIARCKGCGEPPLLTYFDAAQTQAHLTCVNPQCQNPQFTSNPPPEGRTREATVREWNNTNAPAEADPLAQFGYVPIAVEGQVDTDFNVWTLPALQAVEASNPDAYLLQTRKGVPTLYVRAQAVVIDGTEQPFIDGEPLDAEALLHRSSRSAVEQSRARPPASHSQNVTEQQSRRPFDPTLKKGGD